MNLKERTETEFVDYKRIFCGEADDKARIKIDKSSLKKEREKRFIKVFLVQCAACIAIICTALILKYSQPEKFETVSSILNGFYEKNITLFDLNKIIDEKIANNDVISAFFNFAPVQD